MGKPEGTRPGSDGTRINPTLRPQTLTLLRTYEARRSVAKVCEILMRYISSEFIFIQFTRSGAGITSDIFPRAFGDLLFGSFFIRNSTEVRTRTGVKTLSNRARGLELDSLFL